MSTLDLIRSFAEARCDDGEYLPRVCAFTYGEVREMVRVWQERDTAIMEGLRLTVALGNLERECDAATAFNAIGDSFWKALKPLNLRAINVINPGLHVTDLIIERDELALDLAATNAEMRKWVERAKMLEQRGNDLNAELQAWRDGGVTEEILHRKDGYIKVGRGCLIVSEHYLKEKDAEIAALKAKCDALRDQLTLTLAIEAALTAERKQSHGCLSRLLHACAPQCVPLDDLPGLATQIDNYVAGLKAKVGYE